MDIPSGYYERLAQIESNNRPFARAATSTASGLYQFTRSTWERLGGVWGGNSGQAFGGFRPSEAEQRRRVEQLTQENAQILRRSNIDVNASTLYAAHFLGATGARRILNAPRDTPIEQVTGADQRRANPTILRGTVGDFFDWLQEKTGVAVDATNRATQQANRNPIFTPPFTAVENPLTGPLRLPDLPSVSDILNDAREAATGAVDQARETVSNNPVTQSLDFFRNLFSQETGLRVLLVVIGLILLGLAAASLVAQANPVNIAKEVLK